LRINEWLANPSGNDEDFFELYNPNAQPVSLGGLYLTDTLSRKAFFAPASDVRAYAGNVIVGSELKGLFWVVRPRGSGFEAKRLTTSLRAKGYNLEGMTYVSP